MSNIISWDCGYRLKPWNKCGFLGLQLSWATFSTQNPTLRLLAGEYKQSVGNFLWFLPIQFRNSQSGGTQQHLWLWPPHKSLLKGTMVMATKKPADHLGPWSPTREPAPQELWCRANCTDADYLCWLRWVSAFWIVEGLAMPLSDLTFTSCFIWKAMLLCSAPCFAHALTHVVYTNCPLFLLWSSAHI